MDIDGKYIIFKETIDDFIDNILTLNKNSGSYKNNFINKTHKFYIDYPIVKWDNATGGFELNIVNSDAEDLTSKNNKVKVKNISTNDDANWYGSNSNFSTINTTTEYYINIANTNKRIIRLAPAIDSTNFVIPNNNPPDNTDIASNMKLTMISNPIKQIQNDTNTELINIQNISNIRVKINVIAEDKIVKNTYTYIIQI